MVTFYVTKIRNKDINPGTAEAWKVEDVPNLWKKKVEAELQKA